MKKEYVISVELDNELETYFNNVRWKHIDIDVIIQEELEEYAEEVIRAYGEEE